MKPAFTHTERIEMSSFAGGASGSAAMAKVLSEQSSSAPARIRETEWANLLFICGQVDDAAENRPLQPVCANGAQFIRVA